MSDVKEEPQKTSDAPPPYTAPPPGFNPPPGGYPPPGQPYPPPGQPYPPPGQAYPPPGQAYPPPGQAYPPPGQVYPGQPYGQPGQGPDMVIVHTQPQSAVVVRAGNCPSCRTGILVDQFTCCGIFMGIFFFPIGLICCMMMKRHACSNCGAVF